ncbi:hypothetical protein F5B22DRAFT_297220 [Xylaria bambusicola]|uniref:uncharacterized protein n=1 Tax=Xylaria bambusicola TaxID=326684 RepID=UPI002008466D|nr:uncharacterized protein F5B22DRAFT_297220 [Xylaria bambusicola]KAI0512573.1 hypothetical protein F5B22DRAFT_297220 [Xylaria bambusicola]
MASLACTSCRAKKQRCDRELPSCMQCINAQQPCRYPDQHKRGLPAGFLNALEARLRETEEALFYALSELHEGTVENQAYARISSSHFARRALSQSKSEMMEMWAHLPLGDRSQAKAWFLSLRLGGDEESSPTNIQLELPQSGANPGAQPSSPSSSSSQDAIENAQARSARVGDMMPSSPRQTSPLLDSSTAAPASYPRSQSLRTLAEKTTTATEPSPRSMTSAPDSLGLSTRVKAIVESRRDIYF